MKVYTFIMSTLIRILPFPLFGISDRKKKHKIVKIVKMVGLQQFHWIWTYDFM